MNRPQTIHLLDPRSIHSSRGVRLRVGNVTKSPLNPLFGEDRPWESSGDNLYPNVVFDPVDRVFKLWYTPFLDRVKHNAQTLCYAVSDDGLRWTKPELSLHEFRGSKANNILLPFITGAGVALDAHATNSDERFKMTYLVHPELAPEWAAELRAQGYPLSKRGAGVGFSADGVHWKLRPDNPVLPGIAGDTHNNWVWCEDSKKYVLFTRANVKWEDGKERPGAERVVKRWESDDFIHWGNGQIVFRAKGDEIGRRQYYSMPTFRYGNGWLGLLALLNSDPADDTVDCELAWSADTIHWQRLCRGESFIARGASGSHDAGCIYAGWSPVLVGDELRIYYAGSVGTHGSGINRHSSFLLATLPRDRYAGVCAEGEGEIITRESLCTGRNLSLNADGREGNIEVQLLHPDGLPIPGFESQLRGENSVRAAVTWREHADLRSLEGKPVRVRARLTNATLYSLEFGDGELQTQPE